MYNDFDDFDIKGRGGQIRGSRGDGMRSSRSGSMKSGRGGSGYGGYDVRAERRRRKRRRKMLQAMIPAGIAVVLIIIIAIIAISTGLFEGWGDSSEKADLNEYFGNISQDVAVVVKNGEITGETLMVNNGTCYIDFDTVKSEYADHFYYDVNDGALLYTNAEGVISAPVGQNSYTLNGVATQTDYTTSILVGDDLYIAINYLKLYSNFSYELYGGNGEPYRINIQKEWGTKVYAKLNKDKPIRIEADKKGAILKELKKGTAVEIISSENEDWMYVATDDLIAGYIQKKYLDEKYEEAQTPVQDVQEVSVPTVADGSTVVLAWHNVTNTDSARYLGDYSSHFQYFNTISPTWFYLSDNEGTISSIATHDYVTMCHNAGIKVWGLVENMTYADVSTYEVLSYSSKRAHVIEQLIAYAKEYELDGINVDFEQLSSETGAPFVQFIRELSLAAHKENLVVSVDNYVPKGYTEHYNRKEQGVFADYVIIMGYDEHYNGSAESGSVASLGFVLDGIQKTIAEVPASKVINAVPFYTRIWSETQKSDAEINAGAGQEGFVPYNLEVQTLGATDALNSIKSAGATITWSEESGQNYAEYKSGNKTVKCWLEDADSIKAKMNVMKANGVAGVAAWQLAYGTAEMWQAIDAAYAP